MPAVQQKFDFSSDPLNGCWMRSNWLSPAFNEIAPTPHDLSGSFQRTKGAISVACEGIDEPIPIGSLGDGTWRLLGLALSLIHAKGGVLLVDEIDTGLHYSVMPSMWKLVLEAAKSLDVQVFATTHSRDCWEALASVSRSNVSINSEVTIQNIQKTKLKSTVFSERQIILAAWLVCPATTSSAPK